MPRLSFVLLTWNSEKFLNACFDSVIRACSRENIPYEVIVVDNGSSDGSVSVVKKYQEQYPNNFILIALDSNRGTTYGHMIVHLLCYLKCATNKIVGYFTFF
jgi:poly(ribitol-phosphate) beta-glucosyltransferase